MNPTTNKGITCPNCKSFIHISMEALLRQSGFQCNNCLTKFSLDNPSNTINDKMQQFNEIIDKAKDFLK